jgi:hypothetical protein
MKESFENYLAELKCPPTVVRRVDEMLSVFKILSGKEIERIFLTNPPSVAGGEEYESLWGFAPPFWLEARHFQLQQDIDVAQYEHTIEYLGLQYGAIDFLSNPVQFVEDSSMQIEVRTTRVEYSTLLATGPINCPVLLTLLVEVLRPNLNGQPGDQQTPK